MPSRQINLDTSKVSLPKSSSVLKTKQISKSHYTNLVHGHIQLQTSNLPTSIREGVFKGFREPNKLKEADDKV